MKQSKTMLEGSEWKLILLFTLPLMAGNLLQQLYNTVDGIVVGNFVGETALAAVGTCAPLTMLFTVVVCFAMRRHVRHISMVESMKAPE